MSFGVPQSAGAIELYNFLVRTPYSERDEIGKLELRLRQLRWQKPSDLRIAVATLQAFLMVGKASEAIELADWLWERRHALEIDVEFTFASQLMDLARTDRARSVLEPMLARDGKRSDPDVVDALRYLAFLEGDLSLLVRLAASLSDEESPEHRSQGALLGAFMAHMRETGLAAHFVNHQRIVREAVFGFQCAVHVVPFTKEGGLDLCIYSFGPADRTARRILESKIDNALALYYAGEGLPAAIYVPFITTSLLDLSACPAPRGRS